ncbi:MAG TPA: AAA family ATPase [Gemmatimonadales bacterium]|nr:AAA family ATPase [Gemmatimonadales bacterium]
MRGGPAAPELLWRKNLALLVYLARSPKRTRTRDHLVALLWPDKPQSSARHSLREAIRALRHAVGPDVVSVRGDQVELTTESVTLDVDRLAELTDHGDWMAAAALVGGDFMEGFSLPDASSFEDWLAAERLAWRHRSVQALTRAAEICLARGDSGATTMALRAATLDPLSEVAVATLMRSLALLGDRAGALQQFERYERLLRESGSATPAALETLAARIRAERMLRLPAYLKPETARGAETRRAPLAGRAETLRRLTETWAAARQQGTCAVAVILGEAGIGKTRLVDELSSRASLEGGAATRAIAVAADQSQPATALLQLASGGLLQAPGVSGARPEAIRYFTRRLPEWAERFGVVRADEAEHERRAGPALADVIRAAGHEGPLLVALDDAHWADSESLAEIPALAREVAALPVLLVLTAAPHVPRKEIDELRAHVGRDVPGIVVTLDRLTLEDVRVVTRWAFPDYADEALDRITRRVFADSAGIPLLVVELVHAIALGMELVGQTTWPQPAKTLDQTLPGELPDPIIAATRVGFRRLSRDAQHVLLAIAVLGDRVAEDVIRRVSGLADGPLGAALDELEWQRWVTTAGRSYSVVARITREVILRDMVTAGQRERFLELASKTD